jgi:hypothetical protein
MTSDPDFEARVRRQLRSELSGLTSSVDSSTVRERLAHRPRRPWILWRSSRPVGRPQWAGRLMVVLTVAGVLIAGTLTAGVLIGLFRSNAPTAPAGQAGPSALASTLPTLQPTLLATPVVPSSCAVTRPDPPFAAPSPYPSQPPGRVWYGSEALWTMLMPNGEVWSGYPIGPGGITQKTFWFSTNWPGTAVEPVPAITVTGTRLDGSGSFTFGPGTNASAQFGEAMLVGIEVPTPGCWQITGHYAGSQLSYVVWIPPAATPATPSPTATPAPLALPNPGGTCSASQIVVGTVTSGSGPGASPYAPVRFVYLPLSNVGSGCALHLPTVIGVASATGPFTAVSVEDTGTMTTTGDIGSEQSASIGSGASLTIRLSDWWFVGFVGATPPPCLNPVSDVTRVAFPLATGSLQIELPTPGGSALFQQVCSSPASMTANIDLSGG